MSDRTPDTILAEMKEEGIHLNLEALAAAFITMQAYVDAIAKQAGVDVDSVVLDEPAKERRAALLKSIAERMVRVAVLSAESTGSVLDPAKITDNVAHMLQQAAKTEGTSIEGESAIADQIFAGVDDDDFAPVVTPISDVDTPSDSEVVSAVSQASYEGSDDLLAVLLAARAQKLEAIDGTSFKDNMFKGRFFTPENAPETPEEFAERDSQAVDYFKNMLSHAEKAEVISTALADQVRIVLHGGVNFEEKDVVGEGEITSVVLGQGQDRPGFFVEYTTQRDISETIIAAYSVSIAQLRGAYVVSALDKLNTYMTDINQKGYKLRH